MNLRTFKPSLLTLFGFVLRPLVGPRVFAVAALTWRAAFRSRFFIALAALLLASVVLLPLVIKDDGTARGFTQILITYTLSSITVLLGLTTLWLSCGSLAKDIEECQMQVVVVKPVGRWQVWLGKWLGIVLLNAVLLVISGLAVYGLLMWRAQHLPEDQRQALAKEVLVARGSLKEKPPNIEADARRILQEQLQGRPVRGMNLEIVRRQIEESVRAVHQVVPPGHMRRWEIEVRPIELFLKDKPLTARLRFYSAQTNAAGAFVADLRVGPPDTPRERAVILELTPDAFHEVELPPNMWDENGRLTIQFINFAENDAAVLFPLEDGLEILYREGGFGLNFCRGLAIVLFWLALLSALGLACASLMSFPVASFASVAVLVVVMSSSVITTTVENQTIMGFDESLGTYGSSPLDVLLVPVFTVLLKVIHLVEQFSPIDSLSSGRSVSWTQLAQAAAQIVLLLGGSLAGLGIAVFTRRELATAQGTT